MGYTFLVVDDSALTRSLIKRVIAMVGIPIEKIYEAANGKQALEQLALHRVDLVLADLNMPEMTGIELTRKILSDSALQSTPVVVVSAEPNVSRIAELQKEGIRGYLRKPFTPEALRNIITEVLGAVHV